MFEQIRSIEIASDSTIIENSKDTLSILLGKLPEGLQPDVCIYFLKVVALNVYNMFQAVMINREGIG